MIQIPRRKIDKGKCTHYGCGNKAARKGLCWNHYMKERRENNRIWTFIPPDKVRDYILSKLPDNMEKSVFTKQRNLMVNSLLEKGLKFISLMKKLLAKTEGELKEMGYSLDDLKELKKEKMGSEIHS